MGLERLLLAENEGRSNSPPCHRDTSIPKINNDDDARASSKFLKISKVAAIRLQISADCTMLVGLSSHVTSLRLLRIPQVHQPCD